LRDKLSNYKLPTILKVVPELPKTATLKVPKLLLRKQLFETGHPDIQKWTPKISKLVESVVWEGGSRTSLALVREVS
jgi:hypothetical protein